MARFPDGWVFIPTVNGPKVKEGKAFTEVSVEERELVMCKSCKCYNGKIGYCYKGGMGVVPDFYCADGERGGKDGADA